jgi:hypothetical protein
LTPGLPSFRKGGGSESPHAALHTVEGPERRLASPGHKFQPANFFLPLAGSAYGRFSRLPQPPGIAMAAAAQYHPKSVPESLLDADVVFLNRFLLLPDTYACY